MRKMCHCLSEMHPFQLIGGSSRPNPDCESCNGTGFIDYKYDSCQHCGTEADCTYVSQEDGLCQSCRNIENYYENHKEE